MDNEQLDQDAESRFRERQPERQAKLNDAAKGVIDFTEMLRRDSRRKMLHPNDGQGLERILGSSDLLEVNFLDIGRRSGRTVGRIQIRDLGGRIRGFGTGFVVSPSLLLTNNHVLREADNARRSLVDFDYEDDENFNPRTPIVFGLDPDKFFFTDQTLDFTLVAIRPVSVDGAVQLATYGLLPLNEEKGKILVNEYVAVIQHPGGATKKVALRNNQVVDIFDHFLHYTTDTDRGSSGSPILNDQWQVVGLHHAGVRKRDSAGRILAVDGTVWTPSMGEDKIAYIANEGIRISSILAKLREVAAGDGLPAGQKTLLDEFFAGPISSVPPSGSVSPVVAEEHELAWFKRVRGYVSDFLGPEVALPVLSDQQMTDVATRTDGQGHVLEYVHFSAVMSRSRRMAYYTAVNIDGNKLKEIKRDRDVWYFDPRIPREHQAGPDLYERNELDRGHLVRRLDPVWGRPAATANEDTFHFTNAAPQHKHLNRRTWNGLEDYILNNSETHNLKVSVFTGPVFRADDLTYRGVYQIPAEFWKVVVMVKKNRALSATAYLQTQKNLLDDLEFAFGAYRTYQVPVSRIEAITGLDFGRLHEHDPLAGLESVGPALVIGDATDISL